MNHDDVCGYTRYLVEAEDKRKFPITGRWACWVFEDVVQATKHADTLRDLKEWANISVCRRLVYS